jgi:hypothetical protein
VAVSSPAITICFCFFFSLAWTGSSGSFITSYNHLLFQSVLELSSPDMTNYWNLPFPSVLEPSSPDMINKHYLKILQETLLNSVVNELLPFMVGRHNSFTLLSVKDDDISALSAGHSSDVHGI